MGASRCIECSKVFFSAKLRVGRCAACRLKAAGGIPPASPDHPAGLIRTAEELRRGRTRPAPRSGVPVYTRHR
jgi:hypothetical protein